MRAPRRRDCAPFPLRTTSGKSAWGRPSPCGEPVPLPAHVRKVRLGATLTVWRGEVTSRTTSGIELFRTTSGIELFRTTSGKSGWGGSSHRVVIQYHFLPMSGKSDGGRRRSLPRLRLLHSPHDSWGLLRVAGSGAPGGGGGGGTVLIHISAGIRRPWWLRVAGSAAARLRPLPIAHHVRKVSLGAALTVW